MESIIFHQENYSFIRIINNKSEFCVHVEVIINAFFFFLVIKSEEGVKNLLNFENHPVRLPYQPSLAPIPLTQLFLM